MKTRLILATLLLGCANLSFAASTPLCSGTAGAQSVAGNSANYIQADFSSTCSNNVQLAYDQDTTKAVVCANSKKGKNNFGGSTNGKAPVVTGTCTVSSGACSAQAAVLANDGC